MIVVYHAVVIVTVFMFPAIIGAVFGNGSHQKFLDDYVDGGVIIAKWIGVIGLVGLIIKAFYEVFK